MPEPEGLTIEMEPVRGGKEFGPVQPEPQQVSGVTVDEQLQDAAQFEQRYGQTAPLAAKQASRDSAIREELRGVMTSESIENAVRDDRERNMGSADDTQTYRFVAKTADGREIEELVAASTLDVAALQAWDAIKERDRSGVQIASAQLEWSDKQDGPQVEYLYDRKQGIESYRPEGLELKAESRTVSQSWLEKEAQLIRESSEVSGRIATEDIPLAEAYYNGRRDAFNSAREDVIQHNPELAATVPRAIEADEIRIEPPAIESENLSLEFAS